MKMEGMHHSELDINNFLDKSFHTFRKTKLLDESYFLRYNPFNLINKHHTRNVDDIVDALEDFPRRVFRARPQLILSVDNEYMAFEMGKKIKEFYDASSVVMPTRMLHSRFVKDFRQFTLQYVDYMAYTIPLFTATQDGFRFPSTYVGQYGVYDAIRHLIKNDKRY